MWHVLCVSFFTNQWCGPCLTLSLSYASSWMIAKDKNKNRIKWSWNKAPGKWLWWKMNRKFNSQGVSGVDAIRKFKSTKQISSFFPTSLLERCLKLILSFCSSSLATWNTLIFIQLSFCKVHFLHKSLAASSKSQLQYQFSSVTQWCPTVTQQNAAHQDSLSITNSQSLLKLMSI